MASQVMCIASSTSSHVATVLPPSSFPSVGVTCNASSSISTCNRAAPTVKVQCHLQMALSSPAGAHNRAAACGGNGKLVVRAAVSSESEDCSRRTAMLAGASGIATGLLLLLPVRSAEARTVNPGVRRKLREELDKLKEEAIQNVKETKATVQEVANKAQATVSGKVAGK